MMGKHNSSFTSCPLSQCWLGNSHIFSNICKGRKSESCSGRTAHCLVELLSPMLQPGSPSLCVGINISPLSIQNFIHRKLEEKEEAINKLHADGDQLLAQNHPGKNAIEVSTREGSQLPTHPRAQATRPDLLQSETQCQHHS